MEIDLFANLCSIDSDVDFFRTIQVKTKCILMANNMLHVATVTIIYHICIIRKFIYDVDKLVSKQQHQTAEIKFVKVLTFINLTIEMAIVTKETGSS